MLGQRRRRCTNIKPASGQRIVFAGICCPYMATAVLDLLYQCCEQLHVKAACTSWQTLVAFLFGSYLTGTGSHVISLQASS